ncbi:hypothetical protein JXA70_10950 [candidate division KSB1 bacterium]|nr:hypothetical protein [candidate division KSB1 bacterium]
MPDMNNKVSRLFNEMADLLELEGANDYRIQTYRRAARHIANLQYDVKRLVEKSSTTAEIDGLSRGMLAKIKQIISSGRLKEIDDLKKRLPDALQALFNIPAIGPHKIQKLYLELDIRNKSDLRTAIKSGQVQKLSGFDESIVNEISEYLQKSSSRLTTRINKR